MRSRVILRAFITDGIGGRFVAPDADRWRSDGSRGWKERREKERETSVIANELVPIRTIGETRVDNFQHATRDSRY